MFGPFSVYVRPYRKRISLAVLAIALARLAAARIPLLVGRAVDSLGREQPEGTLLHGVENYALAIVALALAVALGSYAMRRLLGGASARIEYDIRRAYFAHLLSLSLSYYQRHRTGDLMARATNDLNSVRIFFTYGVRGIAEVSLTFAFGVTFMCLINWQLALIVLAPLPLFSLLVVRMAALVHTRFKAIQEFFGEMSNFIQENLAGARVVKAYVQGPAQLAAFDELNHTYLEKNYRLIRTRATYRPLTYLIAAIGLGLNLFFGGHAVMAGNFSIGAFVAFNAYLTQLIRPIMYMGWVIDRFQRALVAMRRINEVMEVEPEIRDPRRPTALGRPLEGRIEFRHLSFSYGAAPVLRDISLEIPSGATVGIMGRVGAGKTTLARLVPRLIQAAPGQVLVDGVPVEEWSLKALRGAIGYVSQNPFLFTGSIGANLAYGAEGAGETKILEAAEQAQLKKDVDAFERGFDTLVGERGVTLSGGQKQRSALARALILHPRILILDDALAAVDTHTEEAILGHLRRGARGRTTLIIAHRISTLRDADYIVVLDQGRIAEQGTHQELLGRGGFYAELFARQQIAAELEAL